MVKITEPNTKHAARATQVERQVGKKVCFLRAPHKRHGLIDTGKQTRNVCEGDRGYVCLKVEFLLKTDDGYPKDAEVTLSTLANPGSSLRFNTHWSAPPVSALARSGGPGKMSQSPVSRNSNIERRMNRPKFVVGFIRGVA